MSIALSDAVQPSHPMTPSSLFALSLAQHQRFSNELAVCMRWPKYWSFSFSLSPSNDYSGLISLNIDWFDLLFRVVHPITLTRATLFTGNKTVCFYKVIRNLPCLSAFTLVLSPIIPPNPWQVDQLDYLWESFTFQGALIIHVTPWLIHVNVWQNPLKCCEVISLQLIKINEKKKKNPLHRSAIQLCINVEAQASSLAGLRCENPSVMSTYHVHTFKSAPMCTQLPSSK